MTYSIDNGQSERITGGLAEHEALRVAQRIANERDETVYLYEDGSSEEPQAVEPERYHLQINTGPEGWRHIDGWGQPTEEAARAALPSARKHWDFVRYVGPDGVLSE